MFFSSHSTNILAFTVTRSRSHQVEASGFNEKVSLKIERKTRLDALLLTTARRIVTRRATVQKQAQPKSNSKRRHTEHTVKQTGGTPSNGNDGLDDNGVHLTDGNSNYINDINVKTN